MSALLGKGANVALPSDTGLERVVVGLGWQAGDADLDASALLLTSDGRVPTDGHFVFYNNLTSPDGAVQHTGDATVGAGRGHDESLEVVLHQVDPVVVRVVFAVSIHDAEARGQTFADVHGAYIELADQRDGRRLARFELGEDAGSETAMLFGELYRYQGAWKFRAVGQGYSAGLRGIATDFGVVVD